MRISAWVVAAALILLCSCSGVEDPHAVRLKQLSALVNETIEAGIVVLRYNPADCSCPPFEMKTGDAWTRVELSSGSDPALLQAFVEKCAAELAAGQTPTHRATVSLESGRPEFTPNGTPFFRAELILADPPEETTEEK